MVTVSVIIVNYNGVEHLPDCLDSLAAQSFRDFEVIVVDNGSRDDSLPLIRKRYPWVRLVPLPKNTGFATGNNRGFEEARGSYIVTLNNDTAADPQWLAKLVQVAQAHPRAGMVGCRVCSFDEPDLIDSIGVTICKDGMSRGQYRNQRWSALKLGQVVEILLPSACVALYRRAMLEEIGFFDDDFFAYAEDTDLGLRGRLAGWDAVAATGAVVRHKYSQSGGAFSPFKVYLVERNHYWVALKNFPLRMLLLVPFYTLGRYAEQVLAVLGGHGTGAEFVSSTSPATIAWALLRGVRDAVLYLPCNLKKRRRIMRARKIGSAEMVLLLAQYRMSFRTLLDRD